MNFKDLSLVIFVMILWGANFSFIKIGLYEIDSLVLAALRFLLCSIPLIFFVKKPDSSQKVLLIYSFLFGFGLWGISNYAIQNGAPPGVTSLILQFSPLFTIILSFFYLKSKINKNQSFGLFVSFFGLIFLILFRNDDISILNITYILLSAFCWSVCNIIIKKFQPDNMFSFIVWTSLYSSIILFFMVSLKDIKLIFDIKNHININLISSLISQSYITTLFGYWAWNSLMKKHEPYVIAPFSLLVPVFSILISYILFQDTISINLAISIILILSGLIIFSIDFNKFKKQ